MSLHWGMRTRAATLLFIGGLVIPVAGCEYGGSSEPPGTGPRETIPHASQSNNPEAAETEDLKEWSSQQLKPAVAGQTAGSASSKSGTGYGFQVEPGGYELQFLCEGSSASEISMVTWAESEILTPQVVTCDGGIFSAQVEAPTKGVDLRMDPTSGDTETRYAFRLIPAK